jgi:hypothetical protein
LPLDVSSLASQKEKCDDADSNAKNANDGQGKVDPKTALL